MEFQQIDSGTLVSPGAPGKENNTDIDLPRFYWSDVEERDMFELKKEGDPNYCYTEYANDLYIQRYPDHWEQYQSGKQSVKEGETMLSSVP